MNRCWYSEKQKEIRRKQNHSEKAEVLTDDGWEEYTEWCSDGGTSRWEDAVLVAESRDALPLRIDGDLVWGKKT